MRVRKRMGGLRAMKERVRDEGEGEEKVRDEGSDRHTDRHKCMAHRQTQVHDGA